MKKKLVIFYILSSVLTINAQKSHSFDFTIGSMYDKNFNLQASNINSFRPKPSIDNRYAGFFGVNYSYKGKSKFSPIIGAKFITRRVNYVYTAAGTKGFMHNTIELPIALRYSNYFNNQYSWFFDFGPGINMSITNDNVTKSQKLYENDASLEFVNSKKPQYFLHARLGLESNINENNSIAFVIGYQYQLSPLFYIKSEDDYLSVRSAGIATHYFSAGLSYRFNYSIKK